MTKKQRRTYREILNYRYGIPARHLKTTKHMQISNRTKFLKRMVRSRLIYSIPKYIGGIELIYYFTTVNAKRYLATNSHIANPIKSNYLQ